MIHFDEDKQNERLDELRKREEEELVRTLGKAQGVPYVNLSPLPINMDALRLVKEKDAREAKLAAFDIVGKKINVAVLSPNFEPAKIILAALEKAGYIVTLFTCSTDSLEKAWSKYKDLSYAIETKAGALEVSSEDISTLLKDVKTLADVKREVETILSAKKSSRISHVLEVIIAGALATQASDIHLEPEEDYVRLRYRLDGVLNNVLNFERDTFALILSRVKLLSGLKLNIKTEAQDGRFTVKIGGMEIEIRTSILPGAYSESIVLRILNPDAISVPLEDLGIPPRLLEKLLIEIAKPNGMILNTGPTGSGKTTTLYAFMKKVHTDSIKIITIEDPIEYHLPGIVQTQTNPDKGYTFLEGLRSALRQDPDIIMVGEIRDAETAKIAVNSALTGHLVFSTLHTNTAAGAFPRLIDLGADPKVMTSAISVAMAQRLVRKLCTACRKEVPLEGKEKEVVEKILASLPSAEPKPHNTTKAWAAAGCDACHHTGYQGRIGLYEAILMDELVEKTVQQNPSERELKRAALHQGILDMRQDGILKVLQGVTSFDELSRIIDLDEELPIEETSREKNM